MALETTVGIVKGLTDTLFNGIHRLGLAWGFRQAMLEPVFVTSED